MPMIVVGYSVPAWSILFVWFLADERKENVHIDVFEDETVVMGIGKNYYSFKHCAENIITEIALHLAYTASTTSKCRAW